MKTSRIVVIGTSAGGMHALQELGAQLPPGFLAPIFIVQHMTHDADAEVLARALGRSGPLPCVVARNGQRFRAGQIYVAPADSHMLLKPTTILVAKGARENRYRPAIDPLFRSAAVTHGSHTISVVLTGLLDDGTEGTVAVKRCGGTTIVQDPRDAAYAEMPRSALRAKVDHTVPLREMGALLYQLVRARPRRRVPIPEDVKIEATIAERVLSDVHAVDALGSQAPYNCPGCGGVLWEVAKSKTLRYRCHTGHAFSAATLLAEQSGKIEETLWITLRMLEERRNLLRAMMTKGKRAEATAQREKETEIHIDRIRQLLLKGPQAHPSARRQPTATRTRRT